MNSWDWAGQLAGWIVFALLTIIAVAVAILIVGGLVLVIVSIAQAIRQSVRTGTPALRLRRTSKPTDVPMPTGPTPPGGAQ